MISAISQTHEGVFDDSTLGHSTHVLEHLTTICANSGLVKHARQLKVLSAANNMVFACKEFRGSGATYADIATVDTAEALFGKLHHAVQVVDREIESGKASEVGIFENDCRNEDIAAARVIMGDFSFVCLENKDRALLANATQISSKCFLGPITYKSVWGQDVKEFSELVERAKTTICGRD
jgi:hypothetical protein